MANAGRRGWLLGLPACAVALLALEGCAGRPAQKPQPEGFEGELAAYLARKLGVRSEFVQKEWDNLPQDLKRGDVHVVLNGYEWSAERERVMASTVPYYAYQLRLIVHKDSKIASWEDLKGKSVGVLRDSAADQYLGRRFGKAIDLRGFQAEGTTGVMLQVAKGGLDATVQDAPVVTWYLERKDDFPDLKVVAEPISPVKQSYYVLFVRPADVTLREKLNQAIREGLDDGSLKRIYERYGLWDDNQEKLAALARPGRWPPVRPTVPEGEDRGVPTVLRWGGDASGGAPYIIEPTGPPGLRNFAVLLVRAAWVTVKLALISMPLAMLAGMLIAIARLYGRRWATWPLTVYVEVVRGTPILLQLAVIYYLLPEIGVRLDPFWAGVLGLSLNYSAYEAENYRAGLLAVPRGQLEAALALGMSRWAALRRVIVPQAMRIVVPPVTNDFISLFKDTSICSAFAVTELAGRYRALAVNNPGMVVELGAITAILYLAMSYPLSLMARRLEKREQRVTG